MALCNLENWRIAIDVWINIYSRGVSQANTKKVKLACHQLNRLLIIFKFDDLF